MENAFFAVCVWKSNKCNKKYEHKHVHTPTKYGIWLICNSVTVALKWTEASYFLVFELVTFSCLLIEQKKAFARTQKLRNCAWIFIRLLCFIISLIKTNLCWFLFCSRNSTENMVCLRDLFFASRLLNTDVHVLIKKCIGGYSIRVLAQKLPAKRWHLLDLAWKNFEPSHS